MRCELLSFFSIFGIQNNALFRRVRDNHVVNCFHFSVSLGYKTTSNFSLFDGGVLWIAFIFQYLWDTKQLKFFVNTLKDCCELLSFFSIFGIQNNGGKKIVTHGSVVNCFHFSVSLGYKTTRIVFYIFNIMLWIAFIFQYLWDTKQQLDILDEIAESCELLSFFSIFGIQNNFS